jgi:hypothetical protein
MQAAFPIVFSCDKNENKKHEPLLHTSVIVLPTKKIWAFLLLSKNDGSFAHELGTLPAGASALETNLLVADIVTIVKTSNFLS